MLTITVAAALALCDAEARQAGELMALHQSGASPSRLEAVARDYEDPAWAARVLPRVLDAETSDDADARELAAFHFAAEVHALCKGSN